MVGQYGEPFRPEPLYRVLLHLPRFFYDHFIKGPIKERKYQNLEPRAKNELSKYQESKGIEAALNYKS